MDVFIEKIVERKKTSKDYLMVLGIIIAGFVLITASFILLGALASSFAPIIAAAIIYFGYYFIKSTNQEFEYAVTNGDIDVDKIIARRKRKRLFTAVTKDIEIVAHIKSDKYTSEYKNIPKKIEAVSSMDAINIFFIVASYKGERTMVYFEPDQRMIDSFKTKMPRKVFEY